MENTSQWLHALSHQDEFFISSLTQISTIIQPIDIDLQHQMCYGSYTVETLYNTIYYSKYFIELNFDKSTQYVALWTHKRHSIPRPLGRAMECFYEYFNRNWPCYKGFLLYKVINTIGIASIIVFNSHTFCNKHMVSCEIIYLLKNGQNHRRTSKYKSK